MQPLTPLTTSFLEALSHLSIYVPQECLFLLWGCTVTLMGLFGKTQASNEAWVLGAVCFEQALQIQGGACIWEAGPTLWSYKLRSVCRMFARWLVPSSPAIALSDVLPGSVLAFCFCFSYGSCLEGTKQ